MRDVENNIPENCIIYNLLKEGRDNRIPRRELMNRMGLVCGNPKDDRDFYLQLRKERMDFKLKIASTKADGGGYWIPKDDLELAEYVKDSKATAIGNFASSKPARDAFKKIS